MRVMGAPAANHRTPIPCIDRKLSFISLLPGPVGTYEAARTWTAQPTTCCCRGSVGAISSMPMWPVCLNGDTRWAGDCACVRE